MAEDVRALRRDLEKVTGALRRLAEAFDTITTATTTGLTALNNKTQRVGAAISGLAVGNIDVAITWPQPWPDTAYAVIPTILSGTGALGSLNATLKNGTKTVNDCVITVANTGPTAVGAIGLDVIGIRT